mmetsp:Transcript_30209/g.43159  ORF Transcript_30209/g.43159 Transcript_30209/m.43159 type:complete len:327 (+) Transcript_30209:1-981(+)
MESSSAINLPLDALIGDISDIHCEQKNFELNGLQIATFTYTLSSWTGQEGNKSNGTVVAIHGGPAFCHNYILPLILLVRDGYTVVFYDQAGCGLSSIVKDPELEAPWLLTIEYYIKELEELIKFMNLQHFFLYGSSWGTIVCQEYAVKQPKGLMGMILDGALSDAELYIQTQWRDRISTLPTITQNLLKQCIANKDFQSPLFKTLNDNIANHFTCRLIPPAECFMQSFERMNSILYSKMQGECEFMIGGVLQDWNITNRLYLVECPVLVLAGEFDTMTEECSQAIVQACPHAVPLITIPRASHCKLLEEPQVCVAHMAAFLKPLVR